MKLEVHRLTIGDSDDPEIIAGFVLGGWADTEKGQWCKENIHDLTYVCRPNMDTWGFDIIVHGEINDPKKITEYFIRWPRTS